MEDELDIIREVGSIASAQGSITLSEILGRKVNLLLPSVDIVSADIPRRTDMQRIGIAVICKISTGINGQAAFVLDEKNAFKLVSLSDKVSEEDKCPGALTEMGVSTIKEIGNIVISAYLGAIGAILRKVILFLPPTFVSGMLGEIVNIIFSSSVADGTTLFIETVFEESQEKINGSFYLVLSRESVSDIRTVCKKMLEELKGK